MYILTILKVYSLGRDKINTSHFMITFYEINTKNKTKKQKQKQNKKTAGNSYPGFIVSHSASVTL